jgi:hypothetical protein
MTQPTPTTPPKPVPQVRVQSGLSAGQNASASCMQNLAYWKNAYNQNCLYR